MEEAKGILIVTIKVSEAKEKPKNWNFLLPYFVSS